MKRFQVGQPLRRWARTLRELSDWFMMIGVTELKILRTAYMAIGHGSARNMGAVTQESLNYRKVCVHVN